MLLRKSALILSLCGGLAGCGGGSSSPPPPPPPTVTVSISPSAAIAQAGTTVQLSTTVANSSNQAVTWSVNGVAGGNTSVGTISNGTYTAPATVTDTTDVQVTATAVASSASAASATITIFAAPPIGVRVLDGAGEFFDRRSGATFTLRGNNYVRFAPHMIVPPVSQSVMYDSMFGPGLYDSARVEAAFAAMEHSGYNIVRALQDCCGATQGIGNPNGDGLSADYMRNVTDFLRRARAHHLLAIVVPNDLPKLGGYQQTVDPTCALSWPGCWNLEYTTTGGITAEAKFWQDFIRSLVAQHAPMDTIFAYQLRGELWYPSAEHAVSGIALPLLPTSGPLTAANGKTYDMSDPAARMQVMSDSLVYWTDRTRSAIQQLAPGAMVGVGFVTGANPYVPPFPAIASSTADYIDGHTGPGEGTTLLQDMTGWGKPPGPSVKPVIMGEFAARKAPFPLEADAAAALRQWQIDSCASFGFKGWLLWSWDTNDLDQYAPDDQDWYATSGSGAVNAALAPSTRPDPCQP